MADSIHLDAYFARIGFNGRARPDLATLQTIHRLHPNVIAFENLSPLMGQATPLDIDSLQNKMVRDGRGGWCFEHNTLLKNALMAIGFKVSALIARVLWMEAEDFIGPRTHTLIHVEIDHVDYIADVGFGGNVLTGPMRLVVDIEQATPHQPYRLVRVDDGFKLQSLIGGAWKSMYRFDLQPQHLLDYEMSSHFLRSHPSSIFRTNLLVGRTAPGKRYGLWNTQFTERNVKGDIIAERELKSPGEIRDALGDVFGINVPRDADVALVKLIQPKA